MLFFVLISNTILYFDGNLTIFFCYESHLSLLNSFRSSLHSSSFTSRFSSSCYSFHLISRLIAAFSFHLISSHRISLHYVSTNLLCVFIQLTFRILLFSLHSFRSYGESTKRRRIGSKAEKQKWEKVGLSFLFIHSLIKLCNFLQTDKKGQTPESTDFFECFVSMW